MLSLLVSVSLLKVSPGMNSVKSEFIAFGSPCFIFIMLPSFFIGEMSVLISFDINFNVWEFLMPF